MDPQPNLAVPADGTAPQLGGHRLGAAAALWSALGIVEWYAVPALVPNEGPLPYIRFAPQLVVLLIGSVALATAVLAGRSRLTIGQRLLYVAPAVAHISIVLR